MHTHPRTHMHAHICMHTHNTTHTPPYGLCAPTADTAHNILRYYYYGRAQTPGQNNNIHNLHDKGTFAPGMGAGIADGRTTGMTQTQFSKQVKYSERTCAWNCKTSCIYRKGLQPDSNIRWHSRVKSVSNLVFYVQSPIMVIPGWNTEGFKRKKKMSLAVITETAQLPCTSFISTNPDKGGSITHQVSLAQKEFCQSHNARVWGEGLDHVRLQHR